MLLNVVKVNPVIGHSVVVRISAERFRSTQAHPQPQMVTKAEGKDPQWDNALPYSKIPGPSLFRMVKNFAPGDEIKLKKIERNNQPNILATMLVVIKKTISARVKQMETSDRQQAGEFLQHLENGRYHNSNLTDMYRLFREDYGDLVRMPGLFGRRELIMSFRPDDYEKLFRTEGQWPLRRGLDTFVHYRKHVRPDIFKGLGGLVTEQGENWHKFRTTVNPVMLQPKTIKLYVNKLDEIARVLMAIMLKIRDEKNELPADFRQWLNRWALESMGVIALDTRFGILDDVQSDEAQIIVKNLREFFELTYQLDVLPSFWKYYKTPTFKRLMSVHDVLTNIAKIKVDEAVTRLDKNPTVESDTQSVLEKLLRLNREIATVMAIDMLLAGVDTTAAAVTGILYCLARNPDKQTKLRDEIRTILPRKDSPLTPEKMNNLPYLRACIKKSIRLYPPVSANVRAAGKDIVLQDYQIPKGTDVAMTSMILQNDERFIAQAKEFLPERWLKEDGYPNAQEVHPFLYLPFGFGVRTCIGKRLSMMKMEVIISRVTRLFEYRWHYGELKVRANLVNVPLNELKFQMTEVDD